MGSLQENKQIITRYFEHFAAGDIAAAASLFHDDARIVSMSRTLLEPVYDGKAAITAAASMIRTAFPNGMRMVVHSLTAEEDRVAAEVESFGVHASGLEYNNRYHFLWVVRDGKIIELREYLDSEHVTDVIFGGARRPK